MFYFKFSTTALRRPMHNWEQWLQCECVDNFYSKKKIKRQIVDELMPSGFFRPLIRYRLFVQITFFSCIHPPLLRPTLAHTRTNDQSINVQ